jgi:hypothetical protein
MGKKKRGEAEAGSKGGRHKTARKMIGLPEPWFDVAAALAKQDQERPMPVVWYLVKLIERAAKDGGISELPPPPWETDEK